MRRIEREIRIGQSLALRRKTQHAVEEINAFRRRGVTVSFSATCHHKGISPPVCNTQIPPDPGWRWAGAHSPTVLVAAGTARLYKNLMPNYRRATEPGGTFFLTLVTEGRTPIFASGAARTMLGNAIDRCRDFHPFELDAIVLLQDHLHLLITLPNDDADFSLRISHIKSNFTRSFLASGGSAEQPRSASRVRQRARGVWQRRFWEHTIRDRTDRIHHLDYIHFNPVKHGYVDCPHAWPHSSFHRFVGQRDYERDWCCRCRGRPVTEMRFDEIAKTAGE